MEILSIRVKFVPVKLLNNSKMKSFLVLVFFAAFTMTVNAAMVQNNNDVVGEWKYDVKSAPYGYEKGTLTFSENEKQLSGEVKFADGYKIKLKDVLYKEGELTFSLYVDYELITVKTKIEGKKMKGTVGSSGGKMELTAEKTR
ncbi:hypothetical protein D1164_04755 [Mariniphaga sediminis]|uniref:Lipocalin-like domain-containing protein n=2 Tax=Mariniphaga sediminis TaxID=1628158 RepID=A0A399D430_9BACT|nr:hypothetical protein D1164_04755 [Mariniphaga sediminis]